MAGIADLPATALGAWRNSTEDKTCAAWAELCDAPVSTFWHRVRGRPLRSDTAVNRQYLTPSEEKAAHGRTRLLCQIPAVLGAKGSPVSTFQILYDRSWGSTS